MPQYNSFNTIIGKIADDLNIATKVVSQLAEEPIVTIFGSARIPVEHKFYEDTKLIAKGLAQKGFSICTGGGPGLMRAGSEGGREGGAKTLGLSIKLPHEQQPNEFLDQNITFQNFAQRKIVFSTVSNAYVVVPGGYGSLDELFEVLTLMQCGIVPKVPVVLYGEKYWSPLVDFIKNSLLAENMIRQNDIELFKVLSDVDETVEYITNELSKGIETEVPKTLIV